MNNQFKRRKTFGTGAVALALAALILPACTPNQEATAPEADGTVTTEEVAEETPQLIGQTVSIRGEFERAVDPNSFVIEDDQFFGGNEVLVINASGTTIALPAEGDDTRLQVTGEVRQFTLAEVEREFDWDWNRDLYVDYENKPAIFAQSIALAPLPDEISDNPDEFYGNVVAVEGEVEEVVSPSVFRMDDGLLVLNTVPNQALANDETVVVTGEVRPLIVADIERDYDLTWDLDLQRKLEAEYKDKPIVVAREVYPSAQPPQ